MKFSLKVQNKYMHISLQLAVKEKTGKVPPTKPIEGDGGGIQK